MAALTDIINTIERVAYVRYCHGNNVHENVLFCRSLERDTTGGTIFQKVDECFKEVGLEWNNCAGLCTDSAAIMTGRIVGFQVKVKSSSNELTTFVHCLVHRDASVTKKMSAGLNATLQDAVKVIDFIETHAIRRRRRRRRRRRCFFL